MHRSWLPAIALLLVFSSCDNELNLTAPWKDIPIVYGIISPADTAHYIRIEKAFLDPAKSAFEVARISDSLYYDDITAALINLTTGQRITLSEVDAANEGYPRKDGVFAESPNILYKATAGAANLTAGLTYRLEIDRSDRLPKVTATTTIVGRPTINRPQQTDRPRLLYTNTYAVFWAQAAGASFYDVILTVHYDEHPVGNPSAIQSKFVDWHVSGNITQNSYDIPGLDFYQFLGSRIPTEAGMIRLFRGLDFVVRAAGQELFEFQRVQQANTGVTSAGGDIPQYTNLTEGLGLFTTSNRHERLGLQIHEESLDSLINGMFTRQLNFQ